MDECCRTRAASSLSQRRAAPACCCSCSGGRYLLSPHSQASKLLSTPRQALTAPALSGVAVPAAGAHAAGRGWQAVAARRWLHGRAEAGQVADGWVCGRHCKRSALRTTAWLTVQHSGQAECLGWIRSPLSASKRPIASGEASSWSRLNQQRLRAG